MLKRGFTVVKIVIIKKVIEVIKVGFIIIGLVIIKPYSKNYGRFINRLGI